MGSPSQATVKRLFGLSGNQCAFPACKDTIVDHASGKVTGRVCHINARSEGGKRYDSNQTEEERHGFDNLVLMCGKHHDVIDADDVSYTVDRLHTIKREHEAKHAHGAGEPPDAEAVASQLIYNLNAEVRGNTVTNGSILTVQNQASGQVAHSITNVNAAPKWLLPTSILALGGLGVGGYQATGSTFIFNTNQQGGQVAQSIVNVGRQARKVAPAAAQELTQRLRDYPGHQFGIDVQSGDGECINLAAAIASALTSGGWTNLGTTQVFDTSPLPAFEIHVPASSQGVAALQEWATAAGLAPKVIASGREPYVLLRIGPDL